MKKTLALILALVMVLGMAACGASGASAPEASASAPAEVASAPAQTAEEAPAEEAPAEEAPAEEGPQLPVPYPEKTVKIGVEIYDPTDGETLEMQAYLQTLVDDGLNVEFIYSEAIASAEEEFQFIDDCYNAGCKGIIGFYNIAMGETVQKCVDYGMYYWGAAIDGEDVLNKFQDDPYVLDAISYGDGDYEGGYALGEYFGKLGAKKVIYSSGGADFGVPMFVARREGFIAAAEEYGLEYIEVSGFPGDAFFADQAAALAEDVDGVAASFNGLDFWAQPIAVAGKTETCPLATLGSITQDYADAFKNGSVSFMSSTNVSRFAIGVALIVNAVDGNAEVLQQDGRLGVYTSALWLLDSPEAAQNAADISKKVYYLEDLEQLIVNLNPEASSQTLADLVEAASTLEGIQAMHEGK